MRYFRHYFDDTLNGVYNYRGDELVNKRPMVMNLKLSVGKSQANGRAAAASRMASRFAKSLKGGEEA